MQMPQLVMRSTNALIGLSITKGYYDIEQPKAEISIEQPPAVMMTDYKPAKLTIDQTEAFESVDIKSISKRVAEFAQKGEKEWLEGIQRRVREGNMLMNIADNKQNMIPIIAKQHSMPERKQIVLDFIPPFNSVKMHYEPAQLNIDWQTNKPIIEIEPQKPIIEYNEGDVTTFLQQKASLEIDVINLDMKV